VKYSKPPRLRLVYDSDARKAPLDAGLKLQFALPLSVPHNVILVDVSNFAFHDLERAIGFCTPRWIFDVRRNARFDVISGGRSHAFRVFSKYDSGYVDIMGLVPKGCPRAQLKSRTYWQRLFKSIFRRSKISGPFLVLSDDIDFFFSISSSFLTGLSRFSDLKVSLSLLSPIYYRPADLTFSAVM
jgi:hypothetical protein